MSDKKNRVKDMKDVLIRCEAKFNVNTEVFIKFQNNLILDKVKDLLYSKIVESINNDYSFKIFKRGLSRGRSSMILKFTSYGNYYYMSFELDENKGISFKFLPHRNSRCVNRYSGYSTDICRFMDMIEQCIVEQNLTFPEINEIKYVTHNNLSLSKKFHDISEIVKDKYAVEGYHKASYIEPIQLNIYMKTKIEEDYFNCIYISCIESKLENRSILGRYWNERESIIESIHDSQLDILSKVFKKNYLLSKNVAGQ